MKTGKARYTPLFLSKADLDVALDNADGQRYAAHCCGIHDPLNTWKPQTPLLLQTAHILHLFVFCLRRF